jgi:hypothetical protein
MISETTYQELKKLILEKSISAKVEKIKILEKIG